MPRLTLLTIYKLFVCPNLNYGDVLYYQAHNDFCQKKLDYYQCDAALLTNGMVEGSSGDKLYQESDLEPFWLLVILENCAFFNQLSYLFTIVASY